MTRIFAESDVTIEILDAHIRDSGLTPYTVQPDHISLRTEKGVGYSVSLVTGQKFIRFSTYLPLNRLASFDQKQGLARRLNEEVFLPVFAIDRDDDLTVAYVLPYTHGLIAGNFVSVVIRFASLLDFIVRTYNDNGLIDFGAPEAVSVADGGTELAGDERLH
ncbi:hypothetical protein WQE_23488 [Paraburkholderia hospita]|uniref:Sensory transduction regulator n=1 Tax=Paraburkholderia hospita TaxID=169430 RepID=A0ABN0FIL0_9BURK|nr:hypothetical protein [Paraburkholderia hospita]EIM98544.1 hypothetical protein WQE_23488 [Paraburkholderia hospita]OUL86630.1 hypothetical protein CA602_15475 [Paraburkholderia hospita]